MAGISVVGRNYYGVFPLRGKLLNVREASHKQIMENAEIQSIKQILGLQHGKQYDSVKTLRYGHLVIKTDQNVGGHYETWNTGVLGPVALRGLDQGKWDLSWAKWTYQVGLKGEIMNLVSPDGISSVDWMQGSLIAQKQQPLTWHKAYFNAPDGDEPLALDMGSMGKGQVWINGQSIGRYWTAFATGNCNGHGEYGKRSLCLIKHKADAW
ncbi:beta-galactosidase 5-like [Camellia sinensis]|uniref:beta-galactosidase 5-like n=1 Tax=Camellia sinensis TaxID=4442 RepID=UPI0010356020|nr:beta-galactosidase 5-like [Camellia sinensis]